MPSSDGIHTLYGKIFIPDGEIRGTVQFVHGMTEHIDRYEGVMTALTDEGYVAFGHNHIGHKYSSPDDELGFFGYSDGFRVLINDVNLYGDAVSEMFPDKKRFLFGHSMGSFIVRLAILQSADKLSGLIISGTGGPNPLASAGLLLCDIITLFKGGKYVSPFMYKMVFGSYNDKVTENDGSSWISNDSELVAKYKSDKYCTFKFSLCALHDLIKLNKLSNKPIWSEAVSKTLPIFIMSGDMDPVGDYGKGVQTVYNRLEKAGCNVKMKLYKNNRHEVLNDISKDEAIKDIIEFVKGKEK